MLAIDDMRDTAKYEAYLRPILNRLKAIDDRAALSIMTNQVVAQGPATPDVAGGGRFDRVPHVDSSLSVLEERGLSRRPSAPTMTAST